MYTHIVMYPADMEQHYHSFEDILHLVNSPLPLLFLSSNSCNYLVLKMLNAPLCSPVKTLTKSWQVMFVGVLELLNPAAVGENNTENEPKTAGG